MYALRKSVCSTRRHLLRTWIVADGKQAWQSASSRRLISNSCYRLQQTNRRVVDDGQRSAYDFYNKRDNNFFTRLFKRSKKQRRTTVHERNIRMAWYAAAMAIGAVGASYAAVPLYKVFCQTTGFGGTTQRVRIVSSDDNAEQSTLAKIMDTIQQAAPSIGGARVHTWTDEEAAAKLATLKPVKGAEMVTIRLDTTVGDVMPWTFEPIQKDIKVVPGETALSFFRVTNHSKTDAITGVATYNVHPPKMGLYFQKIQCFCFEEQRLLPGETVDMPVFFFIDPEVLDDPQVSYVRSVTLSYTFFPTDSEEYDDDDDDDEDSTETK